MSAIFVSLMLLFNISANVSIWPNVKGLSIEDKSNSIVFRNMRGSNCINEFAAMKPVMDAAKTNGYIVADIIGIFGKPDIILNNGNTFKYSLFPSNNGCFGVIEFYNKRVVKYSIENCK